MSASAGSTGLSSSFLRTVSLILPTDLAGYAPCQFEEGCCLGLQSEMQMPSAKSQPLSTQLPDLEAVLLPCHWQGSSASLLVNLNASI